MRCSIGIAFLLLSKSSLFSCGINWREPKTSIFDGVDYKGNVNFIENIGEIYASGGIRLPIYATFNSSYGQSPYLGSGWELPLLEAKIMQMDENTFVMKQPDGWLWLFIRTKEGTILDGSAGWKAEIKGDVITTWAPCGTKITFIRGRINQLRIKDKNSSKDRVFDYAYSGDRVDEIREDGRTLLKVNVDPNTNTVTGLTFSPGKTVSFEQSERPIVQTIGKKNVIVKMEGALSKIIFPDKKVKLYEFAVDKDVQPTLTVNEDRQFIWDPLTNKIVADNNWIYEVKPGNGPFAKAVIGRTNSKGQKELWSRNDSIGQELIVRADGSKYERSWFTSGPASGKTRKFTTTKPNAEAVNYAFSYDESGRLLRRKMGDDILENFEWNSDGSYRILTDKRGKLSSILTYGANGKKASMEIVGEKLIEYAPQPDGATKVLEYSLSPIDGSAVKKLISQKVLNRQVAEP